MNRIIDNIEISQKNYRLRVADLILFIQDIANQIKFWLAFVLTG